MNTGHPAIKLKPGEHIEFDSQSITDIPGEPSGLSKLVEEEVNELYSLDFQFNGESVSKYGSTAARSLDEMFNTDLSGRIKLEPRPTSHQVNNPRDLAKEQTDKKTLKTNEPHPEQLNLSFLLNLLDGVLETPGRILIITTNHPERLDRALIRPGRVDIHLQVANCSPEMIIDILRFFYNDPMINIPDWNYEKAITPAEVNKIILNNFDNPTAAIVEIRSKTSNQWQSDNLADKICGEYHSY
jgi:SpoVK/Ycf46/Vps4 family AAA+-type ATPase